MPRGRRSHSSVVILILLMTTTAGSAVAQMGQGRDPMGASPSGQPAQSPPVSPAPSSGAAPKSGAAAPFDLRDPGVIQEGSVLFSTTCTICHKRTEMPGTPGAAPTLRDTAYDKDYL